MLKVIKGCFTIHGYMSWLSSRTWWRPPQEQMQCGSIRGVVFSEQVAFEVDRDFVGHPSVCASLYQCSVTACACLN